MPHPTPARAVRTTRVLPALLAAASLGVAGVGTAAALGAATGHPAHVTAISGVASARHQTPAQGASARGAAVTTAAVSRSNEARPLLGAAGRVAPLRRLVEPDVLVSLPKSASLGALRSLSRARGVAAVTALDVAPVRTPAGTLRVAGVDPSVFRAFTPRLSAVSDPLWQSVGRGEITVAFSRSSAYRAQLGQSLPLTRADTTPVRLGAFATLGVPGIDAVVSHEVAGALKLAPRREVLVAAPRLTLSDLKALVSRTLGTPTSVQLLRPQAVDQSLVSAYAAAHIPAGYLRLYQAAATTCQGLPWTVLAAIGAVETGHGADTRVSSAGAMGPMQFMPDTWRYYGIDANHDGRANILDPVDAVYSAARYLCASGAGRGGQALYDAIFAYNHADWYVREVAALALRYQ